jgi:hypothetical protein
MLNRLGARAGADLIQAGDARVAVVARDVDFDEFVALEGALDFRQDGGGQALAADHDHGLERVRPPAQRAAFARS